MVFNPNNAVVRLCLQGMAAEESGTPDVASEIFLKAWNEANYDFEKFISAHYVAKSQTHASEKLQWLETTLKFALKINDDSVNSAFCALYANIAKCHEELGSPGKAKEFRDLSTTFKYKITDQGPFYHGTRADLKIGDELLPGKNSNYEQELVMNHIYFTAIANGAGLAAALANGDGAERIYIVEPMGPFENDPNVTDKKFPGNPTRSYRSQSPLKIVGEVAEWEKLTPEELQGWRERLARSRGGIIN